MLCEKYMLGCDLMDKRKNTKLKLGFSQSFYMSKNYIYPGAHNSFLQTAYTKCGK